MPAVEELGAGGRGVFSGSVLGAICARVCDEEGAEVVELGVTAEIIVQMENFTIKF